VSDIYLIGPNDDAGVNEYTRSSGFSPLHFAFLTEPDDDDSTYLRPTVAGQREVFELDSTTVPDGAFLRLVTVRTRQKEGAGPQTYVASLIINGSEYPGTVQSLGAGSAWVDHTDEWTRNPATGAMWRKEDLVGMTYQHKQLTMDVGSPQPRVTTFVAYATRTVPRPISAGEGHGQEARGAILGCKAHPSSNAPRARPSSNAQQAAGSSNDDTGSGA
jgi:hypothetical protein